LYKDVELKEENLSWITDEVGELENSLEYHSPNENVDDTGKYAYNLEM
jgi:hypothetical protein